MPSPWKNVITGNPYPIVEVMVKIKKGASVSGAPLIFLSSHQRYTLLYRSVMSSLFLSYIQNWLTWALSSSTRLIFMLCLDSR